MAESKQQDQPQHQSIREPLIIYREILVPLMCQAGFEPDFELNESTRYQTRFIWRSSYLDSNVWSEHYGQVRHFESNIDVIGIPMGSFLILQGVVVQNIKNECDIIRLKVRCAPRTKSLSIEPNGGVGSLASSSSSTSSSSSSSPSSPSSFTFSPPNAPSASNYSIILNKISRTIRSSSAKNAFDRSPMSLPQQQQQKSITTSTMPFSSFFEEESNEDYQERIRLQLQAEFVYKLVQMFSLKLDDLPMEVKLHILALLPLKSIVAMSRVSTAWRELSLDEHLWRIMVRKYFPETFKHYEKGQSWKALFKTEYRRKRLLEKRRTFSENRRFLPFPALPPSPPLLPIMPPPYLPMLPPPPNYIRDLLHGPNPYGVLFPERPFAPVPFWDDEEDDVDDEPLLRRRTVNG